MSALRFATITTAANVGVSLGYAVVGARAAERNSFLLAFVGAVTIPMATLSMHRGFQVLVARRRSK